MVISLICTIISSTSNHAIHPCRITNTCKDKFLGDSRENIIKCDGTSNWKITEDVSSKGLGYPNSHNRIIKCLWTKSFQARIFRLEFKAEPKNLIKLHNQIQFGDFVKFEEKLTQSPVTNHPLNRTSRQVKKLDNKLTTIKNGLTTAKLGSDSTTKKKPKNLERINPII